MVVAVLSGLALLATASLAVASSPTPDGWGKLRRPLHLPALGARARCPVTGGKPGSGSETLNGRGPAYLLGVGGSPAGVIDISQSPTDAQGWRGQKTPWVVVSGYQGPILVRGAKIGRRGSVRFAPSYGEHLRELRWPAGATAKPVGPYRFWPTAALFRSGGCYAFQADGTSFSTVVVLRVTV